MKSRYTNQFRTLAFIFILFFFTTSLLGQLRDKEYGYYLVPEVLNTYCKASVIKDIVDGKTDINALKQIKGGVIWEVYSDREDNPLYFDATGSRTKNNDKLKFMEPLAVKEVKWPWVNVYSQSDSKNNQNIERGWVNISNLLLTSYAILNENSITKKAMALISLKDSSVKAMLQKTNFQKYNIYFAPDGNKKKAESNKFDIYYVLKETDGRKLLSKIDKLTGSQISLEADVAGWMSNFHLTNWDNRLCMEISSKTRALQVYGASEIPVFPSEASLNNFIQQGLEAPSGTIMRTNVKATAPDPNIPRMPILKTLGDENRKQVATIGTLEKSDNQQGDIAQIMKRIQDAKNRLENVNVLFIIDGTSSMEAYKNVVANSIAEIIKSNELQRNGNNLRFGAVFYRDYPDKELAVEVEPLNTDHQKVAERILTTRCFSADKDLPEAQFNGIITGVQKAGFKKEESNIVVLIGDAGNHDPDPQNRTLDQVCKVLKSFDASLIAFQVVNGIDLTYNTFNHFNHDAKEMLTKTANMYNNPGTVQLESVDTKNTYKLNFKRESNSSKDIPDFYMFGRFTYATGSQAMPTKILKNSIVSTMSDYFKRVENIKAVCEGIKSGNIGEYDPGIIAEIAKDAGLSQEDIQKLKQIKEFSFVGYTANRFYGNDVDCFVPVVFISKDELNILVSTFQTFQIGGQSMVEKKDNLKKAILAQTMKLLGEDSEDPILNKNLNEIWNDILAIPFDRKGKYGKLGKVKLRDLNKISDKDFESFAEDFEIKIRDFKVDNFSKYSFQKGTSSQTFYWIPLSSFPGND